MLQRIQTLYLLIASIIVAALFKIPLLSLKTDTEVLILNYRGILDFASNEYLTTNLVGIILYLAIVFIPVITIFLYKNRMLQMKLCNYGIIFNLLFLVDMAYYVYEVYNQGKVSMQPDIGLLLPVISIVLIVLAKNNIKKDEELIRSVDRIR